MDWLSIHREDIPCEKKTLHTPLPSGESSSVLEYQGCVKVSINSAMKAQKCLRRDYPAIANDRY
ncbi:hypothetical protein HanXRQr2_Chr02g0069391 [Helianthus annuus]|uniref:Uncharacterized protein n=1 Tax=Helianthus annuus TaxID=4232 RepID=A0A9K3JQG2_HELAN|nr:hypothetical protein HanXRQr2_Chr02g0069391 [Helianthus annuus]KAJ0952034.1 hypothetical protein HanPSC8_Chr02g0067431 [Helianthus annuus]